jgi:hypothetical protein
VSSLFTHGVPSLSIPPIEIIPDISSRKFTENSELAERIKDLNLAVFGTAWELGYTVVTANKVVGKFCEKSGSSVYVHGPRAFVEQRPDFKLFHKFLYMGLHPV